jgi:hypothetical protein
MKAKVHVRYIERGMSAVSADEIIFNILFKWSVQPHKSLADIIKIQGFEESKNSRQSKLSCFILYF